jgi:predicted oxidoreductase
MTPTSWSPVAGGRLGNPPSPSSDAPARLLTTLDTEADRYGVSRTSVVLAWLLHHPSGILPIVGSRNPDRIREAVSADAVRLSRESWYRIYLGARGVALP